MDSSTDISDKWVGNGRWRTWAGNGKSGASLSIKWAYGGTWSDQEQDGSSPSKSCLKKAFIGPKSGKTSQLGLWLAQKDYARPRWFSFILFIVLLSLNQLGLSLVILNQLALGLGYGFS